MNELHFLKTVEKTRFKKLNVSSFMLVQYSFSKAIAHKVARCS